MHSQLVVPILSIVADGNRRQAIQQIADISNVNLMADNTFDILQQGKIECIMQVDTTLFLDNSMLDCTSLTRLK